MQIKKYAACAVLGMMSFFTANAQDIMPEALPTRPTAERIVKEVAPVSASFQSESAQTVESSVSYNASFGENVVQTALQYLGASYRLGTSGPTVFDCSGFTSYVYRKQMFRFYVRLVRSLHREHPLLVFRTLKKVTLCSLEVVAMPVQ